MKNRITIVIALLLSIALISATLPAKKITLEGTWRMVSGKTNGNPNPPSNTDRHWEFKKDNTFEGKIYIQDMPRPFNQGVYMLPNDTTLVTIHSDAKGNLSTLAYKFNYSVQNDTLHVKGFFMADVQGKPGLLQMMYIDEAWVKIK